MKVRLSIAGSTDGAEFENLAVNQHRTAGAPRRVRAALRSHPRLEEADNEGGDTTANPARQEGRHTEPISSAEAAAVPPIPRTALRI
jgi:hypothetical protein